MKPRIFELAEIRPIVARLITLNKTSHSIAAKATVTVDQSLPSIWVAKTWENGFVDFSIEAWLRAGFWEEYYDGVPEAKKIFNDGFAQLKALS